MNTYTYARVFELFKVLFCIKILKNKKEFMYLCAPK